MKRSMAHRKRRRLILGIAGVAALVLASFSVLVFFEGDLFLQPSQIADSKLKVGRGFTLGGMVLKGSHKTSEDGLTHNFILTDCKTEQPVQFKGLLPNLFREGQGIVAEGRLDQRRSFVADRVLAKHDENYAPKGTLQKADGVCEHPESITEKAV